MFFKLLKLRTEVLHDSSCFKVLMGKHVPEISDQREFMVESTLLIWD